MSDWQILPPTPPPSELPAVGPRLDTPNVGGSMPEAFVEEQIPDGDWCILAPAVGDAYLVDASLLPGWMTTQNPWWPSRRDNREPREHQPYAAP